MKLHPLHPVSVHLPIACIVFTPLFDLCAVLTGNTSFWSVSALMAGGAVIFGLAAASLGALDFERAQAKAPRIVLWHAVLMGGAITIEGVGVFGRVDRNFGVLTPPEAWAIALGVLALCAAGLGGFFGGELVYRHGVNVGDSAE